MMRKELAQQFKKVERLLEPDGEVRQCAIEFTKLMKMFYEYLEFQVSEK